MKSITRLGARPLRTTLILLAILALAIPVVSLASTLEANAFLEADLPVDQITLEAGQYRDLSPEVLSKVAQILHWL
jgi:hypothetical protein